MERFKYEEFLCQCLQCDEHPRGSRLDVRRKPGLGQKEVTVELTDRIILSPHAAKRLSLLLSNLVKQHEERFGPLNIEAPKAVDASQASGIGN
jgi:hypothetical protein